GNATSLVEANDSIYSIIQLLQQQQQQEEEEVHSSPTTTSHIAEAREVCRYLLPPSMVYDTLPNSRSSSSGAVGSAVYAVIRVYTDSEEYRDRQEEDDNLMLIFNKVMGIPVAERLLLTINDDEEGDDANNYDVMLIHSVLSMLRKLPDLPSSTTQASSLKNMEGQQKEGDDDNTPTAGRVVG
ncbi:hypothetical protein FOZ63_020305, partial [Perkinsus olseni]